MNAFASKSLVSQGLVPKVLVLKDLRLSLDALLPWALIVGGFGVGAVILSRLPEGLLPDALGVFSVAELLAIVALAIGVTAIAFGAWSAAVVAQGDRIRGAQLLAATIPMKPWRIAASKCAAIAIAASVPALVAAIVLACSRILDGRAGTDQLPMTWLAAATFGAAALGVGLALGVSPLVRGPFRVVITALFLGVVAAIAGALVPWLSFDAFVSEYRAAASQADPDGSFEYAIASAKWAAFVVAAPAGIAATAVMCLACGIAALARPRSTRFLVGAIVGGLVLAVGAGVGAAKTQQRLSDDPVVVWSQVTKASDSEVAAAIRAWHALPWGRAKWSYRSAEFVNEGVRRVSALPPEQWPQSALAAELRTLQDYSTRERAAMSLLRLVAEQPERLRRELECAVRFPDAPWSRRMVLRDLADDRQSAVTVPWNEPGAATSSQQVDETLLATLRKKVAEGHAERELMEKLIVILEQRAMDKGEAPGVIVPRQ